EGREPLKPKPLVVEPRPVDSTKVEPREPDSKQPPKPPTGDGQPSKQPPDSSTDPKATPQSGDQKLAVPSEDERHKARVQIEEKFGAFGGLSPLDKARFAKRLLEASKIGATAGDAAVRYEMMDIASGLFAEGGDMKIAFTTIDMIGDHYKIDTLTAKISRLSSAAATAKDAVRIRQIVEVAGNLIDEAVALRRFDTALRIVEVTLRVCQHPDGRPLRKNVANRRKEIRKQQENYERIQTAREKLKADAGDEEANLVLGSHFCFDENNWAGGLPLLAKGKDEGLAQLARMELEKPPQNTDEEIELADAWWAMASKAFGPRKRPIMLRAAHWYKQAQPKLTVGPITKHVDKRLETIARLTEAKVE
ncbi:MAG: hypothetical protein JXM70_06370, partial [Pirellulales bacterium]|nr:hypothetical protein [Pirellulales bacterium]